ncbi:hypothetical protein CO174_02630 [Candidatus Uhrbacteria bacterium CG_4_9_14_3_um_filter_50_9]|uniref:Uncharacterized protein n=1 Tax=Candidatus Uhrbacteria bacterium CG_4_9_14_3_um_filter_50_9 TaxID=1975035 RepID=A0A2M7XCG7_9BACT|nr:MAG: hypothetical protein CO174_02630 [Candidatus Uhrbacteria bacterium CG_4_9_14_3_um_filter_50_9]
MYIDIVPPYKGLVVSATLVLGMAPASTPNRTSAILARVAGLCGAQRHPTRLGKVLRPDDDLVRINIRLVNRLRPLLAHGSPPWVCE